jgi:hypothetical protein
MATRSTRWAFARNVEISVIFVGSRIATNESFGNLLLALYGYTGKASSTEFAVPTVYTKQMCGPL